MRTTMVKMPVKIMSKCFAPLLAGKEGTRRFAYTQTKPGKGRAQSLLSLLTATRSSRRGR